MADASYDVVLIGGGNKGLIAAMYLTKYGGLSVGIFEERHELGGGWTSEETPAPGFLANICAHNLGNPLLHYSPIYEDFPEWVEYGVKAVVPPLSSAYCFSDGRWVGIFSEEHNPSQDRTAKLIARFSEKDAETWLWLVDKMNKYIKPSVLEFSFNPPPPPGTADRMDRLFSNPDVGFDPHWRAMTNRQLMRELFENIDVQLAFIFFLQGSGQFCDVPGGAVTAIRSFTNMLNHGTLQGGTHTLAHASYRIIAENGGKSFTRRLVEKIIIENGTAKGVRLADGSVIEARKAVLSGVDPYQLCLELVGEEHLSPKIIRKIKNLEATDAVFRCTWALKERPRYLAEAFSPELSESGWIGFGDPGEKGMKNLMNEVYRLRMGRWPDKDEMFLRARSHSSYCPGYAPPGRESVLTAVLMPSADHFSEEEWKEKEKSHTEEVLQMWSKFAPNMTWENVIGYFPTSPYYISKMSRNYARHGCPSIISSVPSQMGRFRPIPELASGRMPVKNLYATGAAWHPSGGSNPFQGYIIYKVMAQDLGLRKPWEEKGRPY